MCPEPVDVRKDATTIVPAEASSFLNNQPLQANVDVFGDRIDGKTASVGVNRLKRSYPPSHVSHRLLELLQRARAREPRRSRLEVLQQVGAFSLFGDDHQLVGITRERPDRPYVSQRQQGLVDLSRGNEISKHSKPHAVFTAVNRLMLEHLHKQMRFGRSHTVSSDRDTE